MKTKILIYICVLLFSTTISNSTQIFEFANAIGSSNAEYATAVAYDSDGNSYITGSFRGTVDFDPSASVNNLTSIGSSDIYVAKYDSDGNYVWAFNIGGPNGESGVDIGIDPNGDVIVSGYFNNPIDFDPSGATYVRSASNTDGFVAKYDSDGNFVWANDIGGSQYDYCNNLDIDENGNIYVIGYMAGTSNFNPNGSYNIAGKGSNDIFFSKYDNNGNFLLAEVIGSSSSESGVDIKANSSGQIYISGHFTADLDFDPDAGVTTATNLGGNDAYVAKYDSNGDFLWVNAFSSTGAESIRAIEFDDDENVLILGYFTNSIDFDPSASTYNLTSNGGNDIIFASYTPDGNLNWAKNIGSSSNDDGHSIYNDNFSNIYITGSFAGTVDFDLGTGVSNLTSSGGTDVFVATYDFDGEFKQAFKVGGSGNDLGRSVVLDNARNIFLCGDFAGTVDFDPSAATANRTSLGGIDAFLLKYSQTFPPTLTTNLVNNITKYTLTSGGIISDDGNSSILSKGVVWSTSNTFELGNAPNGGFTSDGIGLSSFVSNVSGLSAGTTYYLKSYATNSIGTGYGNVYSFRTRYEIPHDGNQDGIPDSLQNNISTLSRNEDGTYLTIISDNSTTISDESVSSKSDDEYTYPFGITEFKINASNTTVKIYYHGYESLEGFSYRKLFPDGTYKGFDNVVFGSELLSGVRTAYAILTLIDGGLGDYDGEVNGVIYDPGGPSIPVSANIPIWDWYYLLIILALIPLIYLKLNN